jgi:hypothetical protein
VFCFCSCHAPPQDRHHEWQDAGSSRAYFVRPGSRSRPWIWFRDGDVPAFEETSARFVVEKRGGRWVAVERVDT